MRLKAVPQMSAWLRALWLRHGADRYQALEERERTVLLAGMLILPLILLLFGLILPVQDRLQQLQQQVALGAMQAAQAQNLSRVLQARTTGGEQGESLLARVERQAQAGKVRVYMTRIRPEPSFGEGAERLRVSLKDVPYASLLEFVRALAEKGLVLVEIKMQTARPGVLNVQAVVQG